MDTAATAAGVEGFLAGLRRCRVEPTIHGVVITFAVTPCEGPLAGTAVMTGVGVAELGEWPAIPPHWIHLPAAVEVQPTNVNLEDTLTGWVRHSRQIAAWGDAAEPAQAWLAHVRAVLATARSVAA